MTKLKWTVQFSVDASWIKDGFNLDDDVVLDMLADRLPYARTGTELRAKIIAKPDKKIIRKLQGF
jgi:hypothetical protein